MRLEAADVFLPPDFTIDSDAGVPLYFEGLFEGKTLLADDDGVNDGFNNTAPATPNPKNSSPELGLRMATINQDPGGGQITDGWGNPATWIYTGEIFTGPNGIISFAANNDDSDWLSIAGVERLNDNAWNTATATVVTGLTPNSWVSFEFRVSDTGGGGAGPSGQNIDGAAGWTNTIGAVISHDNENNSLNAADYTYGLAGVNSYEPAGGGPSLFRYQNGFGLTDDLVVQGSATVTINGNNTNIAETSLRFENPSPATLTINDGVGTPHKVLSIAGQTRWATNASFGETVTLAGTSDIRPIGPQLDGGNPVRVIRNGPGKLILDTFDPATNIASTTFAAGAGGVIEVIAANNVTPIPDATLSFSDPTGVIQIGSPTAASANFSNKIEVSTSGTIRHTSLASDTLSGEITVLPNQTVTFDVQAGRLISTKVSANVSGGRVTKSGPGLLRVNSLAARNLTINEGRFEVGTLTLGFSPVLNGGVLALTNTGGTSNVPNPFVISGAGAVEGRGGTFGVSGNVVQLSGGGTFRLAGKTGLTISIFSGDEAGANANFGAYNTYTSYLNGRPGLQVTAITSDGGVEVLSYNGAGATDAPMYSAYGPTITNNIVSRMVGKIYIPQAGTYTFGTTSDDGSMLFINGTTVVSNNFLQAMTRRTGSISLPQGFHDIDIGYYEGGGLNGFVVDWAGPGITGTQTLPNSVLFPNLNPELLANPVNVIGTGNIQVIAANAQLTGALTLQSGAVLNISGNNLTADLTNLPTGAGTYTFAPTNETVLSQINDGGNAVAIVKSGSGVLTIDNLGGPHLQNTDTTITVNEGALGILLGAATSPTGNAEIIFNGGGVILSSKGGNQTYTIPSFPGSAILQARKLATGVAGTPGTPIIIDLQGNLNVQAGNTLRMGTADNYVEQISGVATGSGTVAISSGRVTALSPTALQGLRVNFDAASAVLDLLNNTPTVGALNTEFTVPATTIVGDGVSGEAVLTFNSALNGRYLGALNAAPNNTMRVVKSGSGSQYISGPSQATAYTVQAGLLELGSAALSSQTVPINLEGGILAFSNPGLFLRAFDTDPNAVVNGAPAAYSGILNTLGGVLQRYSALGTPGLATSTAANGNLNISYNPSGNDQAPFAIHNYGDVDTIEAVFTGLIDIPTAGNWTFDPRSDDGTNIFIDGQLVVNNNFSQGINHVSRASTVNLSAGLHSMVITFNEGNGGAGMFVNVTAPGGSPTLLSNSLLRNAEINLPNPVVVGGSGTIRAYFGNTTLGSLTQVNTATLTVDGGGVLSFLQSAPVGGTNLNFTVDANTTLRPGELLGADTLNVSGPGTLLLDFNGAHLASGLVNVTGGNVLAATTPGGLNPLGGSVMAISNGGTLRLTTLAAGANTTYANGITFGTGGGAIRAGRFQTGPAGNFEMTVGSPLNVTNAAPVSLAASDGYTLVMGNLIGSNGPITAAGGTVRTTMEVVGSALAVNAGTLDTQGPLNFTGGGTVAAGATLRFNGNAYTGGTLNVAGTMEFNGSRVGAVPATFDGGLLRVTSGVVDLSGGAVTGTVPTVVSGANNLSGRAYTLTNPPGGFGTEQGIAFTLAANPSRTANLQQDLNFGPQFEADIPFNNFFGGPTGDAFTAAFVGKFTAPNTGAFTFGRSINDDSASIWIDLNQNGILEQFGSGGNERITHQDGCCGPGDVNATENGIVNLVGGQAYSMVFIVEDTGGGSSFAAKWDAGSLPTPGGLTKFVNPADPAQAGVWSSETRSGGARVEVASGAELRAGSFANVADALLGGNDSKMTFDAAAGTTSAIRVLRNGSGTSTIEVAAGNTVAVENLTITPGSTVRKTGAGEMTLAGLSIGAFNGAFAVENGTVTYTSPGSGVAAGTTSGEVQVSGAGTFVLQGSLRGAVTVNNGGTLRGSGSLGVLAVNSAGTVAPGGAAGTTGALATENFFLADGSTVVADLLTPASSDRFNVVGTVALANAPGPTLSLAAAPGFNPAPNEVFGLVINDLDDVIDGTFAGLPEGAGLTIGGVPFNITYTANLDEGTIGNDIALIAVPEPTSVALMLGGFGMLIGAQRLRRRR